MFMSMKEINFNFFINITVNQISNLKCQKMFWLKKIKVISRKPKPKTSEFWELDLKIATRIDKKIDQRNFFLAKPWVSNEWAQKFWVWNSDNPNKLSAEALEKHLPVDRFHQISWARHIGSARGRRMPSANREWQ